MMGLKTHQEVGRRPFVRSESGAILTFMKPAFRIAAVLALLVSLFASQGAFAADPPANPDPPADPGCGGTGAGCPKPKLPRLAD